MQISNKVVEELLLKDGGTSVEKIKELYEFTEKDGATLHDTAVKHKVITETELTKRYAEKIGMPFIQLGSITKI